MRLLLIEDDAQLADLVAMTLTPPWTVDVAHSMREALALTPRDYDCILVDLSLPDSQGLDTARTLVGVAPGVPIVVHTGTLAEEDFDQLLEIGCADAIEKPTSRSLIRRRVLAAVGGTNRALGTLERLDAALADLQAATSYALDLATGADRGVG